MGAQTWGHSRWNTGRGPGHPARGGPAGAGGPEAPGGPCTPPPLWDTTIMFASLLVHVSRFSLCFFFFFLQLLMRRSQNMKLKALCKSSISHCACWQCHCWAERESQGLVLILWVTVVFLSKLQPYTDTNNTCTPKFIIHLPLLYITKTEQCAW